MDYSAGDTVALRVRSIGSDDSQSAPSSEITHVIGAGDPALPSALNAASITVIGGLGNAHLSIATGADDALNQIQVYRVPDGDVLDKSIHALGAPFIATSSTTVTYIDGDNTRANILLDGTLDSAAAWITDASWTVATGAANHSATGAGAIQQNVTLSDGETLRGAVNVSGLTAGSLTPSLFGGTDQTAPAITANGRALFSLDAIVGNTQFGVSATADNDASIDEIVLYRSAPGSIPQGVFDYDLEPQNIIGAPGAISGPFTTTVV